MEEMRKMGSEQNDNDDDDDDDDDKSLSVISVRASEEGGGGDLGDDKMSWLSMEDDTMSELMNLLDTTAHAESEAPITRVKFIDNPYSSPLIFQSSSSYVTINGNEESCGSSFSDSESSVMVSVDMGGIANVGLGRLCEVGGAWTTNEEDRGGGLLKGGEIEDYNFNRFDLHDYNVLFRFLMEETVS